MNFARDIPQSLAMAREFGAFVLDLGGVDDPFVGDLDVDAAESLDRFPGVAVIGGRVSRETLECALLADLIACGPRLDIHLESHQPHALPGTPRRLAQRVGSGAAMALWLGARTIASAEEGLSMGLVDSVRDEPRLDAADVANAWFEHLDATRDLKLLMESGHLGRRSALALERALFAMRFATGAAQSGARDRLRRLT